MWDKYNVWSCSLYSDPWFGSLAAPHMLTVAAVYPRAFLLLYTPSLRKEPNLTCFLRGVWSWCMRMQTQGKKKKQPNFTTATIWSSIEGQPRWNLTWCTDCWDYFVHLLKHRMIYNSLQKGQVVSGWGHPTAGDKQTGRGTNAPHTLRFLCSLAKWWPSYLISLCPNRHVLL